MPPDYAEHILFYVGKYCLNMLNGFYPISKPAALLCRANFFCTSLRTVSLRHKLPFDICLYVYARPALRLSLLHPFRYESLYRSFIHIISINFNSALA